MTKEKRKHKKKSSKRNKRKSRHNSSSDDSSSAEEEWVELPGHSTSTPQIQKGKEEKQKVLIDNTVKDDWLSSPALFASVSRDDIRKMKEKKKDNTKEDNKYMLDKLGQTDRELNPYWKDGGSGLPSESHVTVNPLKQASVTVGDQGAAWLRKAMQRAKEQAQEQGRSLESVVSERWESLEKLESMIVAAEERDKKMIRPTYENKYKDKDNVGKFDDRKPSSTHKEERCSSKTERQDKNERHSRNEDRNVKRSKYEMYKDETKKGKRYFSKPGSSSGRSSEDSEREYNSIANSSREKSSRSSILYESNRNKEKNYAKKSREKTLSNKFSKPSSSSSDDYDRSYKNKISSNHDRVKNRRSPKEREYNSKRIFVKPHYDSDSDHFANEFEKNRPVKHELSSSGRGWKKKTETESKGARSPDHNRTLDSNVYKESNTNIVEKSVKREDDPVLSDKEMNDLGAKLLKAELLGNEVLVEELKAKLEKARMAKESLSKETKVSEEVVILTHTDSKGFTRPVSLGEPHELSGSRRKAKKMETHSGGKRMRYFADDDKYTLQEMFQREKLCTVEDSNEVFAKLASKGVGRDDSARDMEDVFEETACIDEPEEKKQMRVRRQAIEHSKRTARTLDNCQWCLESQKMLKHLIIAIGSSCYICVPPYQSLTDNHCLIVPTQHTSCATQLDEDVWREMQDLRKSVVQMFLSQDEDVVFFESARYLNRSPHMVLNCVPMPKETGDLAPIYFKKAIQECEMEWSNNKKLVELKGKDIRRAVPKRLPYFAVDFGMENGFAHVIEDEKLFPLNFAQEIIGGMLDLDHTIWRKQRKQTFEEQSKKVIQLTKLWSPFDATKNK